MKKLIIFMLSIVLLGSCGKEGCTDPLAENYDVDANVDDGKCEYNKIEETKNNINPESDLINKITYLRDSIISNTFRGGQDYSGEDYVDISKLYDFSFLENESDSYSEIEYVEFDSITLINRVRSYFIGYSNDGKMMCLNLYPLCGETAADGDCYDLFSMDLKTNNVDTIAKIFESNYNNIIEYKFPEDFNEWGVYEHEAQVSLWGTLMKSIIISNCIHEGIFNYKLGDFYKTNSFSIDNTPYKFSLSNSNNKIILSLKNNEEEINIFSKKEEWDDVIYHGYYHLNKANMLCIVITLHKRELVATGDDEFSYEYTHDVRLIGFDLSKKNRYSKKVQSFKSASIIIGSFGDINNAEKQKNKLINEGFDNINISKINSVYRVSLLFSGTKEETEEILKKVKVNHESAWISYN